VTFEEYSRHIDWSLHLVDPQHVDPAEPVVPDRLHHDLSFDSLNQQAGTGCADINSRSCCRSPLTSLPAGKAGCPRIASTFSRCSEHPLRLEFAGSTPGGLAHVNPLLKISCREAGHCQACRQTG
jgi:hypothetical protein